MVVVITSTGGVSKRVFTFDAPGRPGPRRLGRRATSTSAWSASGLGARMLHARLHDPSLSAPPSAAFLDAPRARVHRAGRRPPRTRSTSTAPRGCCPSTASRTSPQINELMDDARAPRDAARRAARARSAERDVLVRIGAENELPALRSLALVAAGYGLPQRKLGTVSVIGPVRMDYAGAIRTVREAAARSCRASSRTSTTELMRRHAARPLRGARRRARRRRDRRSRRRSGELARELHPDVNAPRPRRRGEVQGGRRGLRDPLRRRAPRDLRPLRPRGPALRRLRAELRGLRLDLRPLRRVLRRRRSARVRRRAAGPMQGGDVAVARRGRRSREAAHGRDGRGHLRGRSTRCEHCHGNGAEPGTPIETCERCGGAGAAAGGHAHAVRPGRAPASRATCAAATGASPSSRASTCDGRGREVAPAHAARSTSRPGSPTASASASPAAATPASAAARPATSTCSSACASRRALPARRRRPRHRARRARAARRARRHARASRRSTATSTVEVAGRHAAGRGRSPLRGEGMPRAAPRRAPRRPARGRQRRRSRAG